MNCCNLSIAQFDLQYISRTAVAMPIISALWRNHQKLEPGGECAAAEIRRQCIS